MHEDLYTLDKLGIGIKARVHRLIGNGVKRRRLAEMGITPNTLVVIKRIAPFGNPIEISLRGYELSLRKEDAKTIEVIMD